MAIIILLQISLLFLLSTAAQPAENHSISLLGCPDSCGGVQIPYPFGIGDNCSLSKDFNVTCDTSITGRLTPQLYEYTEIANINIPLGQARLNMPILSQCYNTTTKEDGSNYAIEFILEGTPYMINNDKNKFIVTGCNTFASLTYYTGNNFNETYYTVGCLSTCNSAENLEKYGPSCSGIGCCNTAIPIASNLIFFRFDERYNHSLVHNFSRCSYAMVVETDRFKFNTNYATTDKLINQTVPVIYDFVIQNTTCEDAQAHRSTYACKSSHSVCLYTNGTGYHCKCSDGYEGNPYLRGTGGCRDIDECAASQNPCTGQGKCHNLPGTYLCSKPNCHFGRRINNNNTCELNLEVVVGSCAILVALSFIGFAIYITLERTIISKVKEKYFHEHGGWILWEKIKSKQGFGFIIFTKEQVEQATNNFDNTNIVGYGGNGIVYKGIIKDQMVAIKKCKIVDESKKKEFGKEMLILSQISHKNIVKLLGCCLEVEVPMLVYEFIPNGTLHQYIHQKKSKSCFPFITRLRIAYESAEALAYLHSTASPPIFHGDVKSANILLDKKYAAKVSDFGASILATTDDEVQIVTFVQGTLGYLDPEYMQTHKLTNKSDVYSFGVVLVELLTSKPIIDFDEPEEKRGLAIRFLSAMRENKIQELLDDEIKHENDLELITEVAVLANECLRMKGEDRPTMKKVAEELYRSINKLKQHPSEQEYNPEETLFLLSEGSHHGIEIELANCSFNVDKEAVQSIAIGR